MESRPVPGTLHILFLLFIPCSSPRGQWTFTATPVSTSPSPRASLGEETAPWWVSLRSTCLQRGHVLAYSHQGSLYPGSRGYQGQWHLLLGGQSLSYSGVKPSIREPIWGQHNHSSGLTSLVTKLIFLTSTFLQLCLLNWFWARMREKTVSWLIENPSRTQRLCSHGGELLKVSFQETTWCWESSWLTASSGHTLGIQGSIMLMSLSPQATCSQRALRVEGDPAAQTFLPSAKALLFSPCLGFPRLRLICRRRLFQLICLPSFSPSPTSPFPAPPHFILHRLSPSTFLHFYFTLASSFPKTQADTISIIVLAISQWMKRGSRQESRGVNMFHC